MVSCTPRIQPLPAAEIRMAGTPKIAMRTHGSAASAMSPPDFVPAIADTSGTAASCTAATIVTPMASASQVACTPSPTAAARFPAP